MKHKGTKAKRVIQIYNNGQYEPEKICAETGLRLIYENPVCGPPLMFLLKRKALSRLYGRYCRTALSARKIPRFIDQYNVDMAGCDGIYKSFADFFVRSKSNVHFPAEHNVLGSPCEGVITIHADIDPGKLIAAKDSYFTLSELLGDEALAEAYRGGIMVRIRLTPANYHRIHFFDDGIVTATKPIDGHLYTVSPLALGRVARLYCQNKRELISFSSENFGEVIIVEVGATFAGSIVHCFEAGESVHRGQQAGYFQPGGSLVLLFFKEAAFIPDSAILSQTAAGFESSIQAGMPIGLSVSSENGGVEDQ